MSTQDEIAHAVDLFGSAMHDLAITHYKGDVTEKDLAVYTRRRLELINLIAPPAPGEVTDERLAALEEVAKAARQAVYAYRHSSAHSQIYRNDKLADALLVLAAAAAPGEA